VHETQPFAYEMGLRRVHRSARAFYRLEEGPSMQASARVNSPRPERC